MDITFDMPKQDTPELRQTIQNVVADMGYYQPTIKVSGDTITGFTASSEGPMNNTESAG